MRKNNLFMAAAIVGLIGGTSLAIGQSSSSGGKSSGGPGAGAPNAAQPSSPSSGSTAGSHAPQSSEQRSGKGSSAAEQKGSSAAESAQSDGKPGQTGETMPSPQRKGEAREGHSGAATNSGSAAKGTSARLSGEQRTKIHQTIIKQGNAPRVSNVNFSISVGTTVPRSVRLVAVPAAIIEIQPAWRGYEYFMVGDRVVIVDPNTMQIIAVISA